jgi:hypothetical protein
MGYLDNFDNDPLNKYIKKLKTIFFMDVFFYLILMVIKILCISLSPYIDGHSNFMYFIIVW